MMLVHGLDVPLFNLQEPAAGVVEEYFTCPDADTLHVTSQVTVEGRSATTTQVQLPFMSLLLSMYITS